MSLKSQIIAFYLSEIDDWRCGQKATIGSPMTSENYARRMREEIKRLDREIEKLVRKKKKGVK